ncbi:MAG: helix-turn-helix transcriptional regulator [Gordonia sp. (in: high G+C Gram-positive bacteria)]
MTALDDDLARISVDALPALLRVRPTTREATRELLGDTADEAIDTLIHAGFLTERNGRLTYTAPDATITRLATSLLDQERRRLESLTELVSGIPELTRAWQLGDSPQGVSEQGEVTRGPAAAVERWFELSGQLTPGRPCAGVPDMAWMHTHISPHMDRIGEAFAAGGYEVRYIFPASALDDPKHLAVIDAFVAFGVSVRVSPRIPSWFYVDHRTMAVFPLTWGDECPDGLAIVRSSAVIAAMQTLFDSLWVSAAPYPSTGHGWQSVLDLMSRGKTDEQIAKQLGLGVRTVRRRISDAMDDLGANSRFELGAAWAGLRT